MPAASLLRLWRWFTPGALPSPAAGRWTKLLGPLAPSDKKKHPFDRLHRVDTGGLIYADRLATGHAHDSQNSGYYATAPSLFRGAIESWSAILDTAHLVLGDYSFIDIGCGKGRVVMLASEYAFREVTGVELNPGLARVARRNLRRWLRAARACSRIEILQQDALSLSIPDRPVVLFFFNSFEREMAASLLARLVGLAQTRAYPIDLIYIHPEHAGLFRQSPGIDLLTHVEIPLSPEDAAADVFGVTSDGCAIYRLRS